MFKYIYKITYKLYNMRKLYNIHTSNNSLASVNWLESNLNIAITSQNLGSCLLRLRSITSNVFSFRSTISLTRACAVKQVSVYKI